MAEDDIVVRAEFVDALSRPAKRAERSIEDLSDQVDDLAVQLEVTEKKNERLSDEFKRYSKEADKADKSTTKVSKSTKDLGKNSSDASNDVERLEKAIKKASGNSTFKATSGLTKLGKALAALGAVGRPALLVTLGSLLPAAVTALGGAAAGAVAALAPLTGALVAYPGFALAAVQGVKTFTFAISDFAGALKVLNKPGAKPEDIAAALKVLGPNARAAAMATKPLTKSIQDLRKQTAEGIFKAFGPKQFKQFQGFLNAVRPQIIQTGRTLGRLGADTSGLLSQTRLQQQIGRIMGRNQKIITRLGHAVLSLVQTMLNLVDAGGPLLDRFSRLVAKGAEFIRVQTQIGLGNGKLRAFFDRSGKTIEKVSRILSNFGVGFFRIFKASGAVMTGFGTNIEDMSKRFREFTGSTRGQTRIRAFFADLRPAVQETGKLIVSLAKVFAGLVEPNGVGSFQGFIRQLRVEVLPVLNQFLHSGLENGIPVITSAMHAFTEFLSISAHSPFTALLSQVADLAARFLGFVAALPDAVQTAVATLVGLIAIRRALNGDGIKGKIASAALGGAPKDVLTGKKGKTPPPSGAAGAAQCCCCQPGRGGSASKTATAAQRAEQATRNPLAATPGRVGASSVLLATGAAAAATPAAPVQKETRRAALARRFGDMKDALILGAPGSARRLENTAKQSAKRVARERMASEQKQIGADRIAAALSSTLPAGYHERNLANQQRAQTNPYRSLSAAAASSASPTTISLGTAPHHTPPPSTSGKPLPVVPVDPTTRRPFTGNLKVGSLVPSLAPAVIGKGQNVNLDEHAREQRRIERIRSMNQTMHGPQTSPNFSGHGGFGDVFNAAFDATGRPPGTQPPMADRGPSMPKRLPVIVTNPQDIAKEAESTPAGRAAAKASKATIATAAATGLAGAAAPLLPGPVQQVIEALTNGAPVQQRAEQKADTTTDSSSAVDDVVGAITEAISPGESAPAAGEDHAARARDRSAGRERTRAEQRADRRAQRAARASTRSSRALSTITGGRFGRRGVPLPLDGSVPPGTGAGRLGRLRGRAGAAAGRLGGRVGGLARRGGASLMEGIGGKTGALGLVAGLAAGPVGSLIAGNSSRTSARGMAGAAASGALSGAAIGAMFGPIGAGVGAAAGAALGLATNFITARKEAKALKEEMARVAKEKMEVGTQNFAAAFQDDGFSTREESIQRFIRNMRRDYPEAQKALDKAKVSADTVSQALNGNESAAKKVEAALKSTGSVGAAAMKAMGDAAQSGQAQLQTIFDTLEQTYPQALTALNDAGLMAKDVQGYMDGNAQAIQRVGQALARQDAMGGNARKGADAIRVALQEMAAQSEAARKKEELRLHMLGQLTPKEQEAKQAADDVATALKSFNDVKASVHVDQSQAQAALTTLEQAIHAQAALTPKTGMFGALAPIIAEQKLRQQAGLPAKMYDPAHPTTLKEAAAAKAALLATQAKMRAQAKQNALLATQAKMRAAAARQERIDEGRSNPRTRQVAIKRTMPKPMPTSPGTYKDPFASLKKSVAAKPVVITPKVNPTPAMTALGTVKTTAAKVGVPAPTITPMTQSGPTVAALNALKAKKAEVAAHPVIVRTAAETKATTDKLMRLDHDATVVATTPHVMKPTADVKQPNTALTGVQAKLNSLSATVATPSVEVHGATEAEGVLGHLKSIWGGFKAVLGIDVQAPKDPQGDGPGNVSLGGGSGPAHTMALAAIAATGGGRVTSGYRTPAQNAAAGGSPTSYHLDKANPANDIVTPNMGATFNWLASHYGANAREIIFQHRMVKGGKMMNYAPSDHYDHIHIAHNGGMVNSGWPTVPGLRPDERPVIAQIGEAIIPKAAVADQQRAAARQTPAVVAPLPQASFSLASIGSGSTTSGNGTVIHEGDIHLNMPIQPVSSNVDMEQAAVRVYKRIEQERKERR